MKFPVYNQQAKQIKDIDLSNRIFGRSFKNEVVHQVVVAQQANSREAIAHTKTKGEVRGGGKKPWRQKGIGRARHGSSRSPIWVGGGITFGPRSDRNFSQKVNKKQKQVALSMCLSQFAQNKSLFVFDSLINESGKTKSLNTWIKEVKQQLNLPKTAKKLLLVLADKDEKTIRSVANLKNLQIISATSLNCLDVLNADIMLSTEKAIETIEKHYKKINEAKKAS